MTSSKQLSLTAVSSIDGKLFEKYDDTLSLLSSVTTEEKLEAAFKQALTMLLKLLDGAEGVLRIDHGIDESGEIRLEAISTASGKSCFTGIDLFSCSSSKDGEVLTLCSHDNEAICAKADFATIACAPVMIKGEKRGVFAAGFPQKMVVEESTSSLIGSILTHIGAACERVLSARSDKQRADDLETVNKIGRLVASKLTLKEMVREIVERLGHILETDEVNVILYDAQRKELSFLASYHHDESDSDETEIYPLSDGMNSWIIRNEKALLIRSDTEIECAKLGIRHGGKPAKSWLGVPMIFQGRIIGTITVQSYSKPYLYNERSMELLGVVANQCAVAVENARLFEQVLKRESEKERLYFSLNHDLLALVNPVSGFAKLMKSLPPEADRDRYLALADSVITSSEKITKFVEDALVWGKIQSGKLTLNISRADVYRSVREALRGLAPEMMMRKLEAFIDGDEYRFDEEAKGDKILLADIDVAQMERVFMNLLGNAVKHARSKVFVNLEVRGGFVTCSINDDGDGLPATHLRYLFDDYYQGSTKRKGVGLGLPTVKKIIELHHGAILVESDVGQGFTVEFSWPKTLADRLGRGAGEGSQDGD